MIDYEGEANYVTVLDHYANGSPRRATPSSVQSATPTAETHEYTEGVERFF